MPRFLEAPQGSDLWHEHRCGHATASRFADIMARLDRIESKVDQLANSME